jgi:hypothetical protein
MVVYLRGRTPASQQNSAELNGMSYVSSVDAVSLGPVVWSDSLTNASSWMATYKTPSTLNYTLSANGSLNLSVIFPLSSNAQSIQISRSVNIPLGDNPLVAANVTASRGISYGIRFSGVNESGQPFLAWRETSQLQHRPGLGQPEILKANLPLETYFATGSLPTSGSRITRITFYIEAVPDTIGTFYLTVSQLSASPILLTPPTTEGSYQALILNLNSTFENLQPSDLSLFQVYVSFYIRGTPDLQYAVYFNNGVTEEAESFLYVAPSPVTTYNVVTLLGLHIKDYPTFVSLDSSTIIITAHKGLIQSFQLSDLTFRYLSQSISLSSDVDASYANFLFSYYIVFLFVTPVAIVILLSRGFHEDKLEQE